MSLSKPSLLTREYDAQLHRAEKLAAELPAAKEILVFYRRILSFQKTLHSQIAQAAQRQSPRERESHQFASLRSSLDLTVLLPHFRNFLALIEQHAPRPLATASHELATLPASDWATLLTTYWQTGGLPDEQSDQIEQRDHLAQIDPFTQFFPRAFLQPYAAHLASQIAIPPSTTTPSLCPLCGARPVLGILRPEGDGGKRCLLCSFCSAEWNFRRLLCPACGETDEKKLPVFLADQFPHIRTETCDTCRAYLRTIDLTKDGHAIPLVDDLAALPLSLWAHEHHHHRLHPNLLST